MRPISQAGVLMLAGDIMAQHVEQRGKTQPSTDALGFDATRSAVLCAFVPISTVFYLNLWKVLDAKWPLMIPVSTHAVRCMDQW